MKGINLTVYYNPQYRPCAASGISERYDELLIPCEEGHLDIKGDEENLVQIIHRVISGRDVYHLAPMDDKGQYSFGGSYASTCDSRFSELHGVYGALAIHDRKEW
jgi:hypothetical protein